MNDFINLVPLFENTHKGKLYLRECACILFVRVCLYNSRKGWLMLFIKVQDYLSLNIFFYEKRGI
jgi:hypothetical protein